MKPSRSPLGTVYLLHFNQPYQHARHYVGWATDLDQRLRQHQSGQGARLLQVIQQAGITWTLARTWTGDRTRERQLKRRGGASRYCPQCGITPQHTRQWSPQQLAQVARRFFTLVDSATIANRSAVTYARKRLACRINKPGRAITPGDLLAWTERTTMNLLTYTPPYIRADGSVWCVQEDAETGCENACRMVVDLETGLTLFLPDYLVDVDADQPTAKGNGQPWPLFRWATCADLPHSNRGGTQ